MILDKITHSLVGVPTFLPPVFPAKRWPLEERASLPLGMLGLSMYFCNVKGTVAECFLEEPVEQRFLL